MPRVRPIAVRRLAPLLLAPALLLAGCGEDSDPSPADPPVTASSPTPSGTPDAGTPGTEAPSGGTAMAPAWPPPGCREVVVAARSYPEDARGSASPETAALDAVPEGVRAIRGTEPGGADKLTWYVVDAAGTGVAAVGMSRDAAGTGWLAATVERCADPAPS